MYSLQRHFEQFEHYIAIKLLPQQVIIHLKSCYQLIGYIVSRERKDTRICDSQSSSLKYHFEKNIHSDPTWEFKFDFVIQSNFKNNFS